jgi:hypothetical protein
MKNAKCKITKKPRCHTSAKRVQNSVCLIDEKVVGAFAVFLTAPSRPSPVGKAISAALPAF